LHKIYIGDHLIYGWWYNMNWKDEEFERGKDEGLVLNIKYWWNWRQLEINLWLPFCFNRRFKMTRSLSGEVGGNRY
jgi:hypothetical protein